MVSKKITVYTFALFLLTGFVINVDDSSKVYGEMVKVKSFQDVILPPASTLNPTPTVLPPTITIKAEPTSVRVIANKKDVPVIIKTNASKNAATFSQPQSQITPTSVQSVKILPGSSSVMIRGENVVMCPGQKNTVCPPLTL